MMVNCAHNHISTYTHTPHTHTPHIHTHMHTHTHTHTSHIHAHFVTKIHTTRTHTYTLVYVHPLEHRDEVMMFSPIKTVERLTTLPAHFSVLLAIGEQESPEFKRQMAEYGKVKSHVETSKMAATRCGIFCCTGAAVSWFVVQLS